MFQDISIEKLNELRAKNEMTIIDVRSPSEFADSTIPGSINIPFFTDEERAEIGTLYKQVSTQTAKERGLEIMSAKLPAFVKRFAEIKGNKTVFCWRGGMRSRTTATVLSLMGIHVYRLDGGYRSFRKWVVETLGMMDFAPKVFVLHGNTGTGKTEILKVLKGKGYPVVDLEGLAGHRGSIFGEIGLKSNNQKTFDSLLLEEILRYRDEPYILIEAESKRIGKVVLPEFLIVKKEQGTHIMLEAPTALRVTNILDDYRPKEHKELSLKAFHQIKSRIHTPIAQEIEASLLTSQFGRAVELLLESYYDPRYAHTSHTYGEAFDQIPAIQFKTIEEAVELVEQRIKEMTNQMEPEQTIKSGV
ncbi:tRNA 2-selenouridine(34) synthase MnmH [Paenibacillus dokdonensis]|uniref:tRNA 2-selenouridine(34) synthase MnmH n=1 Tax=Paenibacillus dokdonensis TaxID=2567944 RepID=A0ABU6GJ06_9BACL|nr:tRNA 2-selenouridine(34) synthase MnmH [Paenibacillus dokdonensis]MEC0239688.1 tRNA 2-selenouridine(34) synthase MnmH [Paenibacillus dokdonensis]